MEYALKVADEADEVGSSVAPGEEVRGEDGAGGAVHERVVLNYGSCGGLRDEDKRGAERVGGGEPNDERSGGDDAGGGQEVEGGAVVGGEVGGTRGEGRELVEEREEVGEDEPLALVVGVGEGEGAGSGEGCGYELRCRWSHGGSLPETEIEKGRDAKLVVTWRNFKRKMLCNY